MNKGLAIYAHQKQCATDYLYSYGSFARAFNLLTPFSKGKYIMQHFYKKISPTKPAGLLDFNFLLSGFILV